jgi:hypothetical protein
MDLPANILLPGERLLWSGRPQRAVFKASDGALLAFGLVWAAAGLVLPVLSRGRISPFEATVGALGFLVVVGAVAARQWVLRRVGYALTDRRLVVADRISGRTRASAHLGALRSPVARTGRSGLGSVTFGQVGGLTAVGKFSLVSVELLAIPDAEHVRDLIAQAR